MPPARALIGWEMPPVEFGICRHAVQAEPPPATVTDRCVCKGTHPSKTRATVSIPTTNHQRDIILVLHLSTIDQLDILRMSFSLHRPQCIL